MVKGQGRTNRLSDKKIADALRAEYGNVTATAKALGYCTMTVRRRVNASENLKQVWIESREDVVDIAESKRMELIQAGDWKAIEHALRTWGSSRGHNPNLQITGANGEALIKEHLNADILSQLIARGETFETIIIGLISALKP